MSRNMLTITFIDKEVIVMSEGYSRQQDIIPVCTNNAARDYFKNRGLTYDHITEGDILTLVMLLNQEIKKSVKDGETSVQTIHLSKRIDLKKKTNGKIITCFLYVNSHYFEQRECISFNGDGFIGFAGWADQGNVNPILRAFLKWCDAMEVVRDEPERDDSYRW